MATLRELGRADLQRLAAALEAGKLKPPYSRSVVGAYVSSAIRDAAVEELRRLDAQGFGPQHIGYTVRMLAEERAAGQAIRDRVDIVWTGPEVGACQSRDAVSVARELFSEARKSVLLSTYKIDPNAANTQQLLGVLAAKMEASPGLEVSLFMDVGRKFLPGHGLDDTPEKELVAKAAKHFDQLWPGARKPEVYYDPRSLSLEPGPRACLHAKVVIIDRVKALVTSANLTEAAHERNIEAGVLIEDADVAKSLERQFRSLVEAGLLVRLKGMEGSRCLCLPSDHPQSGGKLRTSRGRDRGGREWLRWRRARGATRPSNVRM